VRTEEWKFVTSWYQKECAAGICCHKRSDVDEGTKVNFIRNMEDRIKALTMEEEQKFNDIKHLWEQLRENGYDDRDKMKIKRRRKQNRNEDEEYREEEKKKKWYGIESAGGMTEKIRRIMKIEGIRTYKKGSRKILDIVKSKKNRKCIDQQKGVVYQVPCRECDKVYIGETKKRINDRLKQHKDDVRLRRENNAIFKHVKDTDHKVNWEGAKVIEQESRMIIRKWKEARRIREVAGKAMNWNSGLMMNEEWEEIMMKEEKKEERRKELLKKNKQLCI
jgi:hypothetical protein